MARAAVATAAAQPFPWGRHAALAWLAVYLPSYAYAYGLLNFLFLCNLGVMLTALAVWRGHVLLLSSQAVAAPIITLVWTSDVVARLLFGRHLVGGTEYMWDPQFPLFTRLLSCYHVVWAPLVIACLRRTGYDRHGLFLQAAIALLGVAAARFSEPAYNVNFAFRDPFLKHTFGGAVTHVAVIVGALTLGAYLPTHVLLRRWLPPARPA